MSARLLLSRTARTTIRQHAYGAGIGLSVAVGCSSVALHLQQQKPSALLLTRYRFDSPVAAAASSRAFSSNNNNNNEKYGGLDPELLRELSKGSVTGFVAGLVLSLFSKTLVLLTGVAVVLTQVASRYGFDVVQQLKLKQRINSSRILSALERDPAFKASFGFFFAMSAVIGF